MEVTLHPFGGRWWVLTRGQDGAKWWAFACCPTPSAAARAADNVARQLGGYTLAGHGADLAAAAIQGNLVATLSPVALRRIVVAADSEAEDFQELLAASDLADDHAAHTIHDSVPPAPGKGEA